MPGIENWLLGAVVQRDSEYGCIPTGIEWMIRVSNVEGVPLKDFQERYNLEQQGIAENSFQTIASAVNRDCPNVNVQYRSFENGNDKVAFVIQLLESITPCLLSLTLTPRGRWHIMPVIKFEIGVFRLLNKITNDGVIDVCEISGVELIRRHNEWPGGNDVAWIESMENK